MATFGYARVSAADQNLDRQLIAMNELKIPPGNIYTDKQSGKNTVPGPAKPAYDSGARRCYFAVPVSKVKRLYISHKEIYNILIFFQIFRLTN